MSAVSLRKIIIIVDTNTTIKSSIRRHVMFDNFLNKNCLLNVLILKETENSVTENSKYSFKIWEYFHKFHLLFFLRSLKIVHCKRNNYLKENFLKLKFQNISIKCKRMLLPTASNNISP